MGNVSTKRNQKATKEVEKYTKPTGLYKTCLWNEKVVRRMILEGTLAPRYPGNDIKFPHSQECPICFMYYPAGLNRSSCCKQMICTECFLQVKPPKQHVSCPFCNKGKYGAVFLGKPTAEEINAEEMEEEASNSDANIRNNILTTAVLASTQDRRRLHEESMRQSTEATLEQERIAQRRGRNSAHIENWYSVINNSRDAARVEQLMIMEAIRRSMMPTENQDPSPKSASPRRNSQEDIESVIDSNSRSNVGSLYVEMELSISPSILDSALSSQVISPAPAPSNVLENNVESRVLSSHN